MTVLVGDIVAFEGFYGEDTYWVVDENGLF